MSVERGVLKAMGILFNKGDKPGKANLPRLSRGEWLSLQGQTPRGLHFQALRSRSISLGAQSKAPTTARVTDLQKSSSHMHNNYPAPTQTP